MRLDQECSGWGGRPSAPPRPARPASGPAVTGSVPPQWPASKPVALAELGQGRARQPERRPVVVGDRSERPVEVDGGLVPVEHGPFEPGATPVQCPGGQRTEQGPAHPPGTVLGDDEKILQVQAMAAGPGREGHEVHGDAYDLAFRLCYQGEDLRAGTEKGAPEVFLGGLDGVLGALVAGQLAHQVDHLADVVGDRVAYQHSLRARRSQYEAVLSRHLFSSLPTIIDSS